MTQGQQKEYVYLCIGLFVLYISKIMLRLKSFSSSDQAYVAKPEQLH